MYSSKPKKKSRIQLKWRQVVEALKGFRFLLCTAFIDANPKNLKSRRHFYKPTSIYGKLFWLTYRFVTQKDKEEVCFIVYFIIYSGGKKREIYAPKLRAGDEAKKHKSPTKSGRVGI